MLTTQQAQIGKPSLPRDLGIHHEGKNFGASLSSEEGKVTHTEEAPLYDHSLLPLHHKISYQKMKSNVISLLVVQVRIARHGQVLLGLSVW